MIECPPLENAQKECSEMDKHGNLILTGWGYAEYVAAAAVALKALGNVLELVGRYAGIAPHQEVGERQAVTHLIDHAGNGFCLAFTIDFRQSVPQLLIAHNTCKDTKKCGKKQQFSGNLKKIVDSFLHKKDCPIHYYYYLCT